MAIKISNVSKTIQIARKKYQLFHSKALQNIPQIPMYMYIPKKYHLAALAVHLILLNS
jgi:hypothetical protein